MEPAIGASTCALGNHKWVVNIGNFTRNPIIVISQNTDLMEKNDGKYNSDGMDKSKWYEDI